MKAADIVINPPLVGFGSLDWRRNEALAEDGYRAAEAMKDKLLPFAVDEAQWTAYQERRRAQRKAVLPIPQFVTVVGAVPSDQARIEQVLAPRVGQPLDLDTLETDLETFAGLDRYRNGGWRLDEVEGRPGLRVEARPKTYAPPFLMLGISLQNTTSDDFAFQLAARYLTFDILGSGSELRIDGAAGAQPTLGQRCIGRSDTPRSLSRGAGSPPDLQLRERRRRSPKYREVRAFVGFDVGVNLGRDSDVRAGLALGGLNSSVESGDPACRSFTGLRNGGRHSFDGQDSPVVPSRGGRALARVDHIFSAPDVPTTFVTERSNDGITQVEATGSMFWPFRRRDRLFLSGGLGTMLGHPLPTEQFQLGAPLRLGADNPGEVRGDHYGVLTAGYLRGVGRLPDFLGGPILVGGWLENGLAFDAIDAAKFKTNVSLGLVEDMLIGPILLGQLRLPWGMAVRHRGRTVVLRRADSHPESGDGEKSDGFTVGSFGTLVISCAGAGPAAAPASGRARR